MPELRNRKHRHRPFMVSNNPVQSRKPHEPSAAIHIDDDDAGFLTSRLTTAQRDLIPEPTHALLIWNLDTAQFEYYDGTQWLPLGAAASGPTIPAPVVAIEKGESILPRNISFYTTQSIEHLADYNPSIILMRYRNGRHRPGSDTSVRAKHKRWVHPSHDNGSTSAGGGKINGGGHYNNSGVLLPPRDTEWKPTYLTPFASTKVAVDFSAWFRTQTADQGAAPFRMPMGFSNPSGYGQQSRAQAFAFAIEIDNPDPNGYTARIRGPLSEIIMARYDDVHASLTLAFGNIPSARRFVP